MGSSSSSSSSSSNSTTIPFYSECQNSTASNVLYTAYTVFSILLLLPIYVFTFYVAFQRWRSGTAMSHSDFFTCQIMILEVVATCGSACYVVAIYTDVQIMFVVGVYLFCIIFPGQTMFHFLTCAERYLAVVHPIVYMRLREKYGVRVRTVGTALTWLLCSGWIWLTHQYYPTFPTTSFLSLSGASVAVIVFCCLSVLYVLTRPGPGEGGGHRERVDQSKQRAFQMLRVITVVLLLRFVGLLVCFGMKDVVSTAALCTLMDAGIWLTVPSSLILPLLSLHRAGRLSPRCRQTHGSGPRVKQ